MRLRILTILISLMIMPSISQACNNLRLTLTTTTFSLNTSNNPSHTARVQRSGTSQGCSFFVTFDYGTATSFSTRHLDNTVSSTYEYPITIAKDAAATQVLKTVTDATSTNDILSGTFPAGSGSTTSNNTYRPKIVPSTYLRFGSYSQTFTASLYRGTLASYTFVESQTTVLTYTQPKAIDVSLVDTGGVFNTSDVSQTMNFGNLVQGQSSSFDLIVNYNAGYRLTVTSTNNGRLKRSTSTTYIPYTLTVSGSAVNLSSGTFNLTDVTGAAPTGGRRLPINVTIGSLAPTIPGSYSDSVTLSVVSVE